MVLKIYKPCKNFHVLIQYLYKPCKAYVYCWKNKYVPRLKNHFPSWARNHKVYVPWNKIYMPRACEHALMSSPGKSVLVPVLVQVPEYLSTSTSTKTSTITLELVSTSTARVPEIQYLSTASTEYEYPSPGQEHVSTVHSLSQGVPPRAQFNHTLYKRGLNSPFHVVSYTRETMFALESVPGFALLHQLPCIASNIHVHGQIGQREIAHFVACC